MNLLKKFFWIAALVVSVAIILPSCSNDSDSDNKKTNNENTEQTSGDNNGSKPAEGNTDTAKDGNWWYLDVDTSAITEDSVRAIFNNNDGQSGNITDIAKTGVVYYDWTSGAKEATVSTRSDKPTDKPASGLRIYVYTNAELLNLYTFDSQGKVQPNGGWPGAQMKSDTVTIKETTYTVTVTITGLDEGEYVCFCGDAYGWKTPCPSWASNDVAAAKENAKISHIAKADENGSVTYKDFSYKTAATEFPVVAVVLADVPSSASLDNLETFVGEGVPTVAVQTSASKIPLNSSKTTVTASFAIDKAAKTLTAK